MVLATAEGGNIAITESMTLLLDLAGTVLDLILAHPVLALFFCAGLVTVIIGVVSQLKHA